jgi:hypothetical protein
MLRHDKTVTLYRQLRYAVRFFYRPHRVHTEWQLPLSGVRVGE